MDNLVVEIRATTRRSGPPRLVPLAEVGNHTGFRSAFAFPPETAEFIRAQGNTSNLRGFPVYADTLFVDFDNSDGKEMIDYLLAEGIGFEQWDSGGRSVHLHIPVEPVCGIWVPAAFKRWTQLHSRKADISFMHPAGMYRLPGTFHSKNPGKFKRLVVAHPGKLLRIEQPAKSTNNLVQFQAQNPQEQFMEMLLRARGEGKRRPYIWLLGVAGFEAGLSFEEVLEHIRWWNSKLCTPAHEDDVLVRQCEYAYRKLQRSAGHD